MPSRVLSFRVLLRMRRLSVPAAAPRSARPIATRAQAQQEVKEQYETGAVLQLLYSTAIAAVSASSMQAFAFLLWLLLLRFFCFCS